MKKFSLLFFILLPLIFLAQNPNSSTKQPVKQKPSTRQKTIGTNHTQNLVASQQHDLCINKKFSVVFYVVLDSTYDVGMATTPSITAMLNNINNTFKRICVSFENCSTVFIPNFTYNEWGYSNVDTIVTQQWYTEKTINIYLVNQIIPNMIGETYAYSFAPPPNNNSPVSKDVIVVQKNHMLTLNSLFPIHALGHFFGLYHTYDEINPGIPAVPPPPTGVVSHEFANSSSPNCLLHGDGICDTEADPYSQTIFTDGNGDFYILPKDNIMSNSSSACRFTQGQYNKMAEVILTRRFYLH